VTNAFPCVVIVNLSKIVESFIGLFPFGSRDLRCLNREVKNQSFRSNLVKNKTFGGCSRSIEH
jgi:hypothetical protein